MEDETPIIPTNFGPIPKIVHQIWIGPHPAPREWMQSWVDFCKRYGWQYMVWDDARIDALKLTNVKEYNSSDSYQQKSDIARYEIMYRYGGLYVDCDMVNLGHDLENVLPFAHSNFIAVPEHPHSSATTTKLGVPYCANGFFASVQGHPALKKMIAGCASRLKSRSYFAHVWIQTGPVLFNSCIKDYPVTLIPYKWVFPLDFHYQTNTPDPMKYRKTSIVFCYNGSEYPHLKSKKTVPKASEGEDIVSGKSKGNWSLSSLFGKRPSDVQAVQVPNKHIEPVQKLPSWKDVSFHPSLFHSN